jgi:ABC-type multidrug transport system ATPase subunit
MDGRTTFIIAHRISTVKQADLVVVIERGAIAQIGTHEELMSREGHYRQIAEAQLFGDESATEDLTNAPSHMKRVQSEGDVAAAIAAAEKEG